MNEIILLSPILSISILSIISIVLDAASNNNSKLGFNFSIFSLIVTLFFVVYSHNLSSNIDLKSVSLYLTQNTLSFNQISYYFDILFIIASIITILASKDYLKKENNESFEFFNLILYALAGMMIISHSNHMLTAFIGIETMSVTFYILAGYFRFNRKSVEASLKYFLLGAFSTGFLVYGMAMIYGATGSFNFDIISSQILTNNLGGLLYLKIGVALIIIGLLFKIAAFPFHQWAPDVYTGSPTIVTAYFSTAGKASAVVIFILIFKSILTNSEVAQIVHINSNVVSIIALISALTMLIGNISALMQTNVKRMLAFSSVAHAGYLLMGLVSYKNNGYSAMVFYMSAYLFMQIGAFVLVSIFEKEKEKNTDFNDYAGMWKVNPWMAVLMSIFLFSLAGLPPFGGFFGKYLLFASSMQSGYTWLTIVGVISSIISMYFYIGLVLKMFFNEPSEVNSENLNTNGNYLSKLTIYLCAVIILCIGILPSVLQNLISI